MDYLTYTKNIMLEPSTELNYLYRSFRGYNSNVEDFHKKIFNDYLQPTYQQITTTETILFPPKITKLGIDTPELLIQYVDKFIDLYTGNSLEKPENVENVKKKSKKVKTNMTAALIEFSRFFMTKTHLLSDKAALYLAFEFLFFVKIQKKPIEIENKKETENKKEARNKLLYQTLISEIHSWAGRRVEKPLNYAQSLQLMPQSFLKKLNQIALTLNKEYKSKNNYLCLSLFSKWHYFQTGEAEKFATANKDIRNNLINDLSKNIQIIKQNNNSKLLTNISTQLHCYKTLPATAQLGTKEAKDYQWTKEYADMVKNEIKQSNINEAEKAELVFLFPIPTACTTGRPTLKKRQMIYNSLKGAAQQQGLFYDIYQLFPTILSPLIEPFWQEIWQSHE